MCSCVSGFYPSIYISFALQTASYLGHDYFLGTLRKGQAFWWGLPNELCKCMYEVGETIPSQKHTHLQEMFEFYLCSSKKCGSYWAGNNAPHQGGSYPSSALSLLWLGGVRVVCQHPHTLVACFQIWLAWGPYWTMLHDWCM